MSLFTRSVCLIFSLSICWFAGCIEPEPPKPKKEGIIGKKTQDIGEYDPAGDAVEVSNEYNPSPLNPLGALEAYGPVVGQFAKLAVQRAIENFNILNERYPKDHEEFMEKIIRQNSIELPVLPGGAQYQYDVENHELKIVEGKKKE